MGATPVYSWPLDVRGDAPSGYKWRRALALAIEQTVHSVDQATTADAILAALAGRIPGERIATEVATSNSGDTTTSEIEAMSVTAPLVSGRTYGIWARVPIKSTNGGDTSSTALYVSSLGGDRLSVDKVEETAGGPPTTSILYGEYTASATGDESFVVGLARQDGSGDVRMEVAGDRPGYLTVDYIRG